MKSTQLTILIHLFLITSINDQLFVQIVKVSHKITYKMYAVNSTRKKVKVKFSDTHYRALGPELIPVYRQSAHR